MSKNHPARRIRPLAVAAMAAAAAVLSGCGPDLGPIYRLASIPEPVLPETSDPSVLREGSDYYVYGSDNHLRAPVTRVQDIFAPLSLAAKNAVTSEAMPSKPPWAARSDQLWAPTVQRFGDQWVMYFSADRVNPPQPHNAQCLGRAVASSPLGPFIPDAGPAHCGINGAGGALDPQFYVDKYGTPGLLAAFGDTETPLHHLPVNAAGHISGPATPLLKRQHRWEYHFIENPAMTYDRTRGNYLLTYSAGRWWERDYSTGIARCSEPTGPCTSDPAAPWVRSSNGRTGPGGLSFFNDQAGGTYVIFASFLAGRESQNGGRSATVMPLELQPAVGLGPIVK